MTDAQLFAVLSQTTTQTANTPGPDNMANIANRSFTLWGFTLASWLHLAPEFQDKMMDWFSEWKITYDGTIVDGIEHTVDAFLDTIRDANTGKMLVLNPHSR